VKTDNLIPPHSLTLFLLRRVPMPSLTQTKSCRSLKWKLRNVPVPRSGPCSKTGPKSNSITTLYILPVSAGSLSLLRLSCDRSIPVTFVDFEYGRLLACMGDKEGARVQLDLLLSGKPLEVNAAGRKVRAVYSSRPRQRYADHLMDTPCTGQVQSRGMSSYQIPPLRLSCLLSFFSQERTAPAYQRSARSASTR
jgi:hypothetical protein